MKGRICLSLIVVVLTVAFYGSHTFAAESAQKEDQKMLFLCYWELNENMPTMQHVQMAKMLTEAGLFPPEGVELIRFDKTPGGWGVTVFRAASVEAANSLVSIWRVAVPGFFKKVKLSPAMPVKDSAVNAAKLFKSIKTAEAKMKEQAKAAK